MHDSERLPIEDELRPAPGVPMALLRRQVEVAQALQEALIIAVERHEAVDVCHLTSSLAVVLEGAREMTQPEDIERSEIQAALEREAVKTG